MEGYEDWDEVYSASDEEPDDDPVQEARNFALVVGGIVAAGFAATAWAYPFKGGAQDESSSADGKERATEGKTDYKPGFRYKEDRKAYEVVSKSSEADRYLVVCLDETAERRPAIVVTETNLSRNYEIIKSGTKEYFCDRETGEVFEKVGKAMLQPVSNMEVLTGSDIHSARFFEGVDVLKNGRDRAAPKGSEFDFKDASAEGKINGHDVKVKTNGAERRIYEVDGKAFNFSGEGWFHSGPLPGAKSNGAAVVKVHVLTINTQDLACVQSELIPELFRATQPGGPLHAKISSFKTHDLMYAVMEGWQNKVPWNQSPEKQKAPMMPGPQGQNAKGFTIYAVDAVAAAEIQSYVDAFLKQKGLVLTGKVNTGNVADRSVNPSGSNRTSLEMDGFVVGHQGENIGALLAKQTNRAVIDYAQKKMIEKTPGWENFKDISDLYEGEPSMGRLKDRVLDLIMRDCKIDGKSCRLIYADPEPGQTERGLMLEGVGVQLRHDLLTYLDESKSIKEARYDKSGKLVQGLTGRPAWYEIARVLSQELNRDLDPARLEVQAELDARSGPKLKLSEAQRQGLQIANEIIQKHYSGLKLTNSEQVIELLKQALDGELAQKWSEAQRHEYESLIEKYQKGDTAANRAVNDILGVRSTTDLDRGKVADFDSRSAEAQERLLAQMPREFDLAERHASLRTRLMERGQIRETLKAAGFTAEASEKLEKKLLSENIHERMKAQETIKRLVERRGGVKAFAREVRGRMGAAVMVAGAILPFLLGDSRESDIDTGDLTWGR